MHKKGYDAEDASDAREWDSHGECVAVMGNLTHAMQAQKTLSQAAIYASVMKVSSSGNTKGCAYGITYACVQDRNVRTVLARAGLAVKKYLGG